MQSATTRTFKRIPRSYLAAACGLTLAFAIVAGIATWQSVRDDGETNATATEAVTTVPPNPRSAAPSVGPLSVVLVGSHEEAARLEGLKAEYLSGQIPPNEVVLAITSEEEAAQAQQLIADAELMAPGSVRVVDLRTR